jgi:hypothetical protein
MTALVRLLLLTLLVTGGSAPRAAVQAPLPSPEGFPADGQPPIVRLLSPGAEPRTPLRYQLDAGQTGRMTMRMDMSIAMDMGGMAMPAMPSPTMVMESEIAVTEVAESGDVSFEITMTEAGVEETPGVDPGMASAMQGMLQGSLKGMRGSGTVSSRGISRAMTFDLGEAADPQMQQAFGSMSSSVEQMSTPLPEEPVGVGARWEVLQRMDHSGAVTFQTLLLEVTAIDGPRVTLAVKADQQAPRQSMSNPGLPPEAVMTLQRLSGSGTGTMTIDLTALVPTSEMSTKSNAVMDVSMAGTSQTMGVETTMTMTIAPGGG